MNSKFTETYLSIISEAWDRYEYLDIIRATNIATNNCKDPWIKGESSAKVFQIVKDFAGERHRTGKYRMGSLTDNSFGMSADNAGQHYDGNAEADDQYISMYWKARSQSGNSFDAGMAHIIREYSHTNPYRKQYVLSVEVGKLAYAIWKALNSKHTKVEQNLKDVEENGFEYTEGQKIENLDLVVKDVKTTMGHSSFGYSYSESTELVCEDQKSGWKYKVRLGKNTSTKLADLIDYAKRNGMIDILDSEFPDIKKINVSGKVLRISKEWKSVTLNYVIINSPSDSEVDSIEEKLREKKAEKDAAATASKKLQETLGTFKLILKTAESNPDLFNTENKELTDFLRNAINSISDEDYEKLSSDDKRVIGKIENLLN